MPGDVYLLIEIADSSLAFDRNQKLPVYGKAGIAEAWIVNLPERCIEVYRGPHFTGCSSQQIVHERLIHQPAGVQRCRGAGGRGAFSRRLIAEACGQSLRKSHWPLSFPSAS